MYASQVRWATVISRKWRAAYNEMYQSAVIRVPCSREMKTMNLHNLACAHVHKRVSQSHLVVRSASFERFLDRKVV
jgi:hypothetical protein